MNGESFVIAKAGKPLVKVEALLPADIPKPKRMRFLAGQFESPDDFDEMGRAEIEALFQSN